MGAGGEWGESERTSGVEVEEGWEASYRCTPGVGPGKDKEGAEGGDHGRVVGP